MAINPSSSRPLQLYQSQQPLSFSLIYQASFSLRRETNANLFKLAEPFKAFPQICHSIAVFP